VSGLRTEADRSQQTFNANRETTTPGKNTGAQDGVRADASLQPPTGTTSIETNATALQYAPTSMTVLAVGVRAGQ
jgi:hypothetical protein